MFPYQQLAKISLDVMATATIRAGDQELSSVQAARQMLHGIATGQLVVGTPVKEGRDPISRPRPVAGPPADTPPAVDGAADGAAAQD